MSHWLADIKSAILKILSIIVIVLPSGIKVIVYRRMFGYKIGQNVKIGLSWIAVQHLEIGNYVTIGNFNRFKNVPEVYIGDYTRIGTGNSFTSTFEFINRDGIAKRGNCPMLVIGEHVGISMLHYFDIQDKVEIGSYTTIAGINSVFFTHYLNIITSAQSTKPLQIGKYCMIGSSVRFVPGAGVSDCTLVGMGAVITKLFTDTYVMVGGNPAVVIRKLPEEAAYFKRTVGWIGEFTPPPSKIQRSNE